MAEKDKVIIVGAGLAGLCCALNLKESGVPFLLLEASDAVGGRIRTDYVDGYTLDRGFQIFLTAYPEAQEVLKYRDLKLRSFEPGAMVRTGNRFHRISDPFRRPDRVLETLMAPVGTLPDKLRIAWLRQKLVNEESSPGQAVSTMTALKDNGFSQDLIQTFFRPFFSGIFLEGELDTSSKLFDFIFKMLAEGDNTIPEKGMQAIPEQLAAQLPADSIRLSSRVERIEAQTVRLESGEVIAGSAIVIATEEPVSRRLLGQSESRHCRSQTCIYFTADEPPVEEPMIYLNGNPTGLITNFLVPTNVAPTYAPPGKALISCVLVGDSSMNNVELEDRARLQMQEWFGKQVREWKHLRTYRIKYALPDQTPESLTQVDRRYRVADRLYCCGDYKESGTINGAMVAGRKAAEAVVEDCK